MTTGSSRREGQRISLPRRASWLDKSEILIFLAGLFLILCGAVLVIRHDYRTTLDSWKGHLSQAVTHQQWTLRSALQQSQDDAQVLADFPPARELVTAGLAAPAATQNQVSSLFNDFRAVYGYAALCLFDSDKTVLMHATSESRDWKAIAGTGAFSEIFSKAMHTSGYQVKEVQTSDRELFLIFVMPVFRANEVGSPKAPIGVVAMFDPFAQELLPLLTSKDFPMHTAETVLLQLHDAGTHSSWPRYVTGQAATADVSVHDTLRAAATQAVDDRATFSESVDYRGVRVMAAMEKISSLDSVVVLKVNRDEALSDFHRTARIEAYAATAIALAYAALILVLRGNRVEHKMRRELRQEHYVNEKLESTVAERTRELAQMNSRTRIARAA